MATLQLRHVLQATGGTVAGTVEDLEFQGVSTDTRHLRGGELFVALQGPHFDAHQFLAEAAVGGARAALVKRDAVLAEVPGLVPIRVDDPATALIDLARFHARRNPARRVAVTGSNGKTTTKNLLSSALATGGETVSSHRSFNNSIGVPLTLLRIEPTTKYAAVELATSGPGEISALSELTAPEVGIITNCSYAHVERLGGLDGVVAEKGALLDHLPSDGVAILNADDPSVEVLKKRCKCPVVTFGVREPADFRATNVRFDLDRLAYQTSGERVLIPLGGCHNVYNSLAAIAAATVLGIPHHQAARGLREVEPPPQRLRPLHTGAVTVLDDTYNANPGSVEAAFRTLAAADVSSRKVVVLGDMKELGKHAKRLHHQAGQWVSLLDLALLLVVGKHAEAVRSGALEKGFPDSRIHTYPDADRAAASIPSLLEPGDTILVKGSRAMAMETVVNALELVGAAGAR